MLYGAVGLSHGSSAGNGQKERAGQEQPISPSSPGSSYFHGFLQKGLSQGPPCSVWVTPSLRAAEPGVSCSSEGHSSGQQITEVNLTPKSKQ